MIKSRKGKNEKLAVGALLSLNELKKGSIPLQTEPYHGLHTCSSGKLSGKSTFSSKDLFAK